MLETHTYTESRANRDDFLMDDFKHALIVETRGLLHRAVYVDVTIEDIGVKEVGTSNST